MDQQKVCVNNYITTNVSLLKTKPQIKVEEFETLSFEEQDRSAEQQSGVYDMVSYDKVVDDTKR